MPLAADNVYERLRPLCGVPLVRGVLALLDEPAEDVACSIVVRHGRTGDGVRKPGVECAGDGDEYADVEEGELGGERFAACWWGRRQWGVRKNMGERTLEHGLGRHVLPL